MSEPTFAIVVTFKIKSDCVDQFRARILQQADDSLRIEPGCRRFDVLTAEDDLTTFVLYEAYDDAEAFEAHKATEHFADYSRTVADWVVSKELRRLQLLPTRGPRL